jgi:hypothetical protein
MRTITLLALTLSFGAAAHADFSYTTTRKTTGGMMASMGGAAGGPQTSKSYFKGQKMKTDSGGATAIILDFDAQTITTINTTKKTYTVKSFSDIGAAGKTADVDVKVDAKETGQRKTINGFNASELVMTMEVDSPQAQQMGKMQMEMNMWLSPDVPGYVPVDGDGGRRQFRHAEGDGRYAEGDGLHAWHTGGDGYAHEIGRRRAADAAGNGGCMPADAGADCAGRARRGGD